METWAGNIMFDQPQSPNISQSSGASHFNVLKANRLEAVRFHDSGKLLQSYFNIDTTLHFLSIVESAAMPLHLVAGSPFDVSTDNELTETWLSEALLWDCDDEDDELETAQNWWSLPSQQSNKAILLKVEDGSMHVSRNRHKITEILIYAVASKSSRCTKNLPTPPASSSPSKVEDDSSNDAGPTSFIKFYALSLSSQVYDQINAIKPLDLPVSKGVENGEGQFLFPLSDDIKTTSSSHKRQRILTKFEDATYRRKRLIRHGGEAVSKAMAGINGSVVKARSHCPKPTDIEDSQFEGQVKDNQGMLLPCQSSIKSAGSSQSRSTRNGIVINNRASLHRMESIAPMCEDSLSLDDSNKFEKHNKSALTRIIMAGMRIYGLEQQKKAAKPSGAPEVSHKLTLDGFDQHTQDGEEYKLVYHQTFKAASFTFRSYLSRTIINQEIMQDVVDRHLWMFCNDPLEVHDENDTLHPGFGKAHSSTQNSFCGSAIAAQGNDGNYNCLTTFTKKR